MRFKEFASALVGWLPTILLASVGQAGLAPNHLNLELLPISMGATHLRGVGFGLSLEKLDLEEGTLSALSTEFSFPLMQERGGERFDWNGSMLIMTKVSHVFYLGTKVGININHLAGPVGYFALSTRILPSDQSSFTFLQLAERQLDLGIMATSEIYGAVRFGFTLF